jgi:aspartate/methionine/tyrosine aminotransferase
MMPGMPEPNADTERMRQVQTPVIPTVADLIRRHPGTISLGQGVVYYPPPPEAIERIGEFLASGANHHYAPVAGIPALRAKIEAKLRTENGVEPGISRAVVVTAGGNLAFVNALLAVASLGDEIILQVPYYFNHEMAIAMAGCRAVTVPTDERYQIQPELIRRAITGRTRAVVTVSPNNPSGAVYPEAALREVNAICREAGIYHISDEAYEYFTYADARHFSPAAIEGSEAHTISLFSLSKAYGFASWRIGYMLIPDPLLESVRKIQDTIIICAPVISQFAALGALEAGRAYSDHRIAEIGRSRALVRRGLAALGDQCAVSDADGAFYFLLRLRTRLSDRQVVERLVSEHRVAVIPGSTFGLRDGCTLRVSYGALDSEAVAEGVERLVGGLQRILES